MKFLSNNCIGFVLFLVLIIFPAIHPNSDLNTNFPTNPVGVAEDVSDDEKKDSSVEQKGKIVLSTGVCQKTKLPKVPQTSHLDMESDVSVGFNINNKNIESISYSISCNAATNNALRLIVGLDENRDSKLSFDEYRFRFGWDTTGWVVENVQLGEHKELTSNSKELRKNCDFVWEFDQKSKCVAFAIKEDGVELYRTQSSESWCVYEQGCNLIRIVRNGITNPEEDVTLAITTFDD